MPRVRCPRCGTTLNVPESAGGRKGGCPNCSGVFRLPIFETTKDVQSNFPILDQRAESGPVRRRRNGLLETIADFFKDRWNRASKLQQGSTWESAKQSPSDIFRANLPIAFSLCGHMVRVSLGQDWRVSVLAKPIDENDRLIFGLNFKTDVFVIRIGESEGVQASPEEIDKFLEFYLETPIGPEVLTLTKPGLVDWTRDRERVVTESLEAWRALDGPCTKDGRLKNAMDCIALNEREEDAGNPCWNRTKNPSGLCRHHNKPNARTLWNHYRFANWDSQAVSGITQTCLRSLPLEFQCCGHVVTLSQVDDGRLTVSARRNADADFPIGRSGTMLSATSEEIEAFFRDYLKTEIGPILLKFRNDRSRAHERIQVIHHSLEAWLGVTAPCGNGGRLAKSVLCAEYCNPDRKAGRSEYVLCTNPTNNVSGLCDSHGDEHLNTLWNFDPLEANRAVAHSAALFEAERENRLEPERARRQEKWEHVAAGISYTATDRQIYFLLDLGADPKQLNDIDKREASALIDELLYGES